MLRRWRDSDPLPRPSAFQSTCLLWKRSRRRGATSGGRSRHPKAPRHSPNSNWSTCIITAAPQRAHRHRRQADTLRKPERKRRRFWGGGGEQPAALERGEESNEELRKRGEKKPKPEPTTSMSSSWIFIASPLVLPGMWSGTPAGSGRRRRRRGSAAGGSAERDGQLVDVALEKGGGADGRMDGRTSGVSLFTRW